MRHITAPIQTDTEPSSSVTTHGTYLTNHQEPPLDDTTAKTTPESQAAGMHKVTTSDMLLEYLQGEGASENRAMVRIDNNVSIEDGELIIVQFEHIVFF